MRLFVRTAQLFKKYALHIRHVSYFLGTRLFAIIAFVLVVPFFIRQASEEQYGLAAIGFSLLSIGTVIDVAFGYVLIQVMGRKYARGQTIPIGTIHGLLSLYLFLASALALGCLALVAALGLSTAETLMYGSFAALLPALSVSGVVAAVFQSRNQLKPINLSRLGFELAKVLALALSALVVNDISLIGPVLLVSAYARAILDAYYLTRLTGIRLRVRSFEHTRRYWRLARHGTYSFFVVALTALVSIGDKILIKQAFSTDAVAHYSIAFDINTKAYLLVNAVNTAMFAVVLHRFAMKKSTFAPLAVGIAAVTVVAALYYLPLLSMTPIILGYWISSEFASSAAPLTRIMVFASLLYLYGNVFENALTAMGHARRVLHVYIFAVTVYSIVVGLAIWQKTLAGFMYGYLALCAVLCLGFILQYRLATRPAFITGDSHACT